MALSDNIEDFIKELMGPGNEVFVQRNELAQHFSCAPSQINYVLSTRFTLDHGYIIVSRRGSGGYIRIEKVEHSPGELLNELACNRIGECLNRSEAYAIIDNLYGEGIISMREGLIMKAAVDHCAEYGQDAQRYMTARIMRAMIKTLMSSRGGD